jgi:hypothetical protein
MSEGNSTKLFKLSIFQSHGMVDTCLINKQLFSLTVVIFTSFVRERSKSILMSGEMNYCIFIWVQIFKFAISFFK